MRFPTSFAILALAAAVANAAPTTSSEHPVLGARVVDYAASYGGVNQKRDDCLEKKCLQSCRDRPEWFQPTCKGLCQFFVPCK